jgi:hypothetical protein
MRLTDFGLWFCYEDFGVKVVSKDLPKVMNFYILFDGKCIASQWNNYTLNIFDGDWVLQPRKYEVRGLKSISVNRPITMDDFDIIPNPKKKL